MVIINFRTFVCVNLLMMISLWYSEKICNFWFFYQYLQLISKVDVIVTTAGGIEEDFIKVF